MFAETATVEEKTVTLNLFLATRQVEIFVISISSLLRLKGLALSTICAT